MTAAGADVHHGALDDLDSLHDGAAAADGVIHAAFINDFVDYAAAGQTDLRAVETLGVALEGSDRPLVVTSVTTLITPGRLGTEEDAPDAGSASVARIASENAAVSMAERGCERRLSVFHRRCMGRAMGTASSRG